MKLKEIITNTKKSKFTRDSNDYQRDEVYVWRRNGDMRNTKPRSILKQQQHGYAPRYTQNPGKESFSDIKGNNEAALMNTWEDFSDTTSEPEMQRALGSPRGSNQHTTHNTTRDGETVRPKNRGGRGGGTFKKRYPLRIRRY